MTSFRCGILLKVNLPSNKREEARIGRAEFFAPEAFRLPLREWPPSIISLSINFLDLGNLLRYSKNLLLDLNYHRFL